MTLPHLATPTFTINAGDHVLIAGPGGEIQPGTAAGFYAADTRLLSCHRLTLNGRRPEPVQDAAIHFSAIRHVLAAADDGVVITLERRVAGGLREEIEVASTRRTAVRVELAIELAADFADMFEVRGIPFDVPHRRVSTAWDPGSRELRLGYRNGSFVRGLLIRCERDDPAGAIDWRDGRLVVPLELEAHATGRLCFGWTVELADGDLRAPPACVGAAHATGPRRQARPSGGIHLQTGNAALRDAWRQAAWDLESLRLADPTDGGLAVPAAGRPWYLALFGRDSIITSLQAIAGHPDLAIGTLTRLAALQATADDPARDMEPGKILHEERRGEVAALGLLPFRPYYGTHDATPLFVILLAQLFHWTADVGLLRRFLPNAEAAMSWIERHGDRDGDGFQEYATRSRHGFANQGWKDAFDAIPGADGSLAAAPIALCEHQALAYDARLRLAELYDVLDRPADAARLRVAAAELRERFNEVFWWEEEGTYLLGLDGAKRPIRSVASNAGQCLASGIVPRDRAARVAARLMAPDMWSGWGIRTLSSTHPAYDPLSYHTGSVWPHDTTAIAAGFARCGLRDEAARLASALLEAAQLLPGHQLPELVSGVARNAAGPPVPYPGANVPQAWAASAVGGIVAALCGLRALTDAHGSRLVVDPSLPGWLGEITLAGIRAGRGTLSLRIAGTEATVLENTTGFTVDIGPSSQEIDGREGP